MIRTIAIQLNNVTPIPPSLRLASAIDTTAGHVDVDLARLFLHHYQDSYPAGPPHPDPSSFEYLNIVSSHPEFRFHDFVGTGSTVKRRAISTELGQAFCRLILDQHFGVVYFAHMASVLDKGPHAAFGGITVRRKTRGDVPDYICSRPHGQPYVAEAKGRFSSISFGSAEFQRWRDQFSRIEVYDRAANVRSLKGYISATRFVTETGRARPCLYLEDPETPGEARLSPDDSPALSRGISSVHYSRTFRKLDLALLATALEVGYPLTSQLSFQVPVWRCVSPPFEGTEFVGGYYRTSEGTIPTLTDQGWVLSPELGRGHAAFFGLQRGVAEAAARAARGDWNALLEPDIAGPQGPYSSEFGWLRDGTVLAPLTSFVPVGAATL